MAKGLGRLQLLIWNSEQGFIRADAADHVQGMYFVDDKGNEILVKLTTDQDHYDGISVVATHGRLEISPKGSNKILVRARL